MLQSIHVKNFALIDDLEIDLTEGMNAITGETGAGKSIVIDAVNFALGKRMPKDIVRDDADYALSELVFTVENGDIRNKLNELDIENEDDLIILSRKISGGRNTCKINGENVTTSVLKQISSLLIDVHGQHEHQSLLSENNHRVLLDNCLSKEGTESLKKIQAVYDEYMVLNRELESAVNSDTNKDRELALISYEVNEIKNAKLVQHEDEELEKNYRKMVNAKKIIESVYGVHQITGYESNGAGAQIGRALSVLKQVGDMDSDIEDLYSTLMDIDSILNDFNKNIADYEESLEFSQEDFINTENRLNEINSLKNKYGSSYEEIMNYLEEREKELQKYEDLEGYLDKLKIKTEEKKQELLDLSRIVSKERKAKAEVFSKEIKEALLYLNFLDSDFVIEVNSNEDKITSTGIDAVRMMISTNPGERLKPLSEVASGGEVSRIMLAIKSVLADMDNIPSLIFDEIDTGISGRTAQKVAEKISVISKEHQVLLVTHLPQIAAMADSHFEISKAVNEGRTVTSVKRLNADEEITELARMLSGAEVTETVINSAKEMKRLARK